MLNGIQVVNSLLLMTVEAMSLFRYSLLPEPLNSLLIAGCLNPLLGDGLQVRSLLINALLLGCYQRIQFSNETSPFRQGLNGNTLLGLVLRLSNILRLVVL